MQFDDFIEKKYTSYSYNFKTDFANVIKNHPVLTDDENKKLMSKILKGRTRSLLVNNPDIINTITSTNLIPIKTIDRILDIFTESDDYTKRNFKYNFVDNLMKNNYKFTNDQIQKLITLGVNPTKFFDKDRQVTYNDFISFLASKDITFDGIKLFLEKYKINITDTKCIDLMISTHLNMFSTNMQNIIGTFVKHGLKLDNYEIVFSKLHLLVDKMDVLNYLFKYIRETNKVEFSRKDVDFLINNYGYSKYLEKDYFKNRYTYNNIHRDILLNFLSKLFIDFYKLDLFTINDFNKFIHTNKIYPNNPINDYQIFIQTMIVKGKLKINYETVHNGFYYNDNNLISELAEANMLGEFLTDDTFRMSCLNTNYKFIDYHLQRKFEPTIEHTKLLVYSENCELKPDIVKCIELLVSYGLLINKEVATILRGRNIDASNYNGNKILYDMINCESDKMDKNKLNEKIVHLIDKKVDPEYIIKYAKDNNINIKTVEYLHYIIYINNFRLAWYYRDKLNIKPSLDFIVGINTNERKFYFNMFY